MRLLLTSDLHQQNQKWKLLVQAVKVEKPDWVFIAGDLLPKEPFTLANQRDFFQHIERYLTEIKDFGIEEVFTYLGNDDLHPLEYELNRLGVAGLCRNMNQRVLRPDDSLYTVAGMAKVRSHPFGYHYHCHPDGSHILNPVLFTKPCTVNDSGRWIVIDDPEAYMKAKPQIGQMLESLEWQIPAVDAPNAIYMVHQPPALCGMDICGTGAQVGSPTVLTFIERTQPLLTLHGHIHESPYQPAGRWHQQIGRTHAIQAGQLGTKLHYVVANVDTLLSHVGPRQHKIIRLAWHHSRSPQPEILEF